MWCTFTLYLGRIKSRWQRLGMCRLEEKPIMIRNRSVDKASDPVKPIQGITLLDEKENKLAVESNLSTNHCVGDAGVLRQRPAAPLATTEVGAGAPEPAKCSVGGLLGGCNGGWCLVRPVPYCHFGFVYGFGYLCRHPEIQRIIARTTAKSSSRSRFQLQPNRFMRPE
jgi:hypothetical protein